MQIVCQAVFRDVIVRLIERSTDHMLVYDSPAMAAIDVVPGTYAEAFKVFNRAVEIADAGLLQHPGWKSKTTHVVILEK